MTEQAEVLIKNLLKEIPPGQPFTIEGFTRQYLQSQGIGWQQLYETQAVVELEKYLLEQGFIVESGTTKLYSTSQKVDDLQ